ncbi:bifunctional protein FolD 2-like [Wolffia australiana]
MMRATLWWRTKRPLSISSGHFSSQKSGLSPCEQIDISSAKRKRNRSHAPILGVNLPDVWDTSGPSDTPEENPHNSEGLAPIIIDGISIAAEIRSGIAEEVRRMREATGKVPGLAVVLVGQRRDSESYVRFKTKACEEVGIKSLVANHAENCEEEDVVRAVKDFNDDPSVHGVLVQLPLPQHMDEERILGEISVEKDVDGFHPLNMGNLAIRWRDPLFIPCAAEACIELLLQHGVKLCGKNVVVIGQSKVVGLPTSLLLQRHNATVSVVHALSKNPEEITRRADIVIAAAGVPGLVQASWLKPGAIVVDVGTNPVEDPHSEHGYRLVGDVCYEDALKVVRAITPVPGGVGPVTIAMLLSNTVNAAKRAYSLS